MTRLATIALFLLAIGNAPPRTAQPKALQEGLPGRHGGAAAAPGLPARIDLHRPVDEPDGGLARCPPLASPSSEASVGTR